MDFIPHKMPWAHEGCVSVQALYTLNTALNYSVFPLPHVLLVKPLV